MWYVAVNPQDYVVHTRRGKIKTKGLGKGFFYVLGLDKYVIIPSTAQRVNFTADQITLENQGVEVMGFAVWKVADPEKAYLNFDFRNPVEALERITTYMTDMVESAIRHHVSNMKVEEVLRKRGSIILRLKQELQFITDRWGLEFDTIEIKNVRIFSEALFANMQAPFRNEVFRASETSKLLAEREVAERRVQHQEEMAAREQELKRANLTREAELARIALTNQKEADILREGNELEVFQVKNRNAMEKARAQEKALEAEKTLEQSRHELAMIVQRGREELEKSQADIRERQVEIENREDPQRLLYRLLPEIAQRLNVREVNVGQDLLQRLFAYLGEALGARGGDSPGRARGSKGPREGG